MTQSASSDRPAEERREHYTPISSVNAYAGGDKDLPESHLDRKLQLVVKLRHEKVVTEGLPHLHDAHHSCINLILSVLKHTLCGADLLLHLQRKCALGLKKCVVEKGQKQKVLIPFPSSGSG